MCARAVAVSALEALPGFKPLDGCHCISSSLARIFQHAKHPLSEEMILGLGAGVGFVYWRMKFGDQDSVFVGGRANLKNFYQDLGRRTGVVIREKQTASSAKAETELLKALEQKRPVMLGGDMGMLPWFEFPGDYHFGGHTFVACGYDGGETVLCSDIDQKASGVKKGFLAPITREQLRKARGSTFKPFPPKNLWLEFDFSGFHRPRPGDIVDSIKQMVDAELNPPIKNFGVRGVRHAADEVMKWLDQFNEPQLRMQLFNLYIFIEIGGTGGGCFRPMYSRFLAEGAEITGNPALVSAAEAFARVGDRFTEVGLLFKDAFKLKNIVGRIKSASLGLREIADSEEAAYRILAENV
jgi:hypothetical protein